MRRLAGILIGTLVFLCACSEETTTAAPPTTTTTPLTTTTVPPNSKLAEACIVDVRKAGRQFNELLQKFDPSNTDPVEAARLYDEIQRIQVVLKVEGEVTLAEVRRRGPVEGGDECLCGSATALAVTKHAFPSGSEGYADSADAEQMYYEAILLHYPDSRFAADARDAVAE
jgi:hypothetical protein